MRRAVILKALLAAVSPLLLDAASAEESEFPSVPDTAAPASAGPTEKEIQKAIMRCLTAVDETSGGVVQRGQGKGLTEEGEDRYCMEQKRACHLDPGGFACRNFVKDYAK